jgi:hypothetical protein
MGRFHRVGVLRKQEFLKKCYSTFLLDLFPCDFNVYLHRCSARLRIFVTFCNKVHLKVPVTPRSSDSCGVVSYSPVSPARCRGRQFYTRSGRCVGPKCSSQCSSQALKRDQCSKTFSKLKREPYNARYARERPTEATEAT